MKEDACGYTNYADGRTASSAAITLGARLVRCCYAYVGSCLFEDVKAHISTGLENGLHPKVLEGVECAKDAQKLLLVQMICRRFGNVLSGKRIAPWDLAFKPHADHKREATTRVLIAEPPRWEHPTPHTTRLPTRRPRNLCQRRERR